MIHFNETLKSLHFRGKFSFLINFNNSRIKLRQTQSWSVFLLLLQPLLNVIKTVLLLYKVVQHLQQIAVTQRLSKGLAW